MSLAEETMYINLFMPATWQKHVFAHMKKQSKSDIFNIGSDNVKSFKNVYQYVIDKVGSTSRVVPLPKAPTLLAMKICYKLGTLTSGAISI